MDIIVGGCEVLLKQFNAITSNTYGNLTINVITLTIVMLIVWYLYKKIARRDMFRFEQKYYGEGTSGAVRKFFHIIFYIIKYGILFPIFSFFMFVLLFISLSFLSTGLPLINIIYISIVIISVIRLLAYVNEDTAQELAKLLPFALILLFLINPNITKQYVLPDTREIINSLCSASNYFIFLIGLEFLLRIIYTIVKGSDDFENSVVSKGK